MNEIVVPSVKLLTGIYSNQPHLVGVSKILQQENISKIDLGRLIENENYSEYTDFMLVLRS